MADALSRNVPVGSVCPTTQTHTIQSFSLYELANAQRQHDVGARLYNMLWSLVMTPPYQKTCTVSTVLFNTEDS